MPICRQASPDHRDSCQPTSTRHGSGAPSPRRYPTEPRRCVRRDVSHTSFSCGRRAEYEVDGLDVMCWCQLLLEGAGSENELRASRSRSSATFQSSPPLSLHSESIHLFEEVGAMRLYLRSFIMVFRRSLLAKASSTPPRKSAALGASITSRARRACRACSALELVKYC